MDESDTMGADAGAKRELPEGQNTMPKKKQKVEKPGIEADISKCLKDRDVKMAKSLVTRILSGEKTGSGNMVQLMFLLGRMQLIKQAHQLYSRLRETDRCSMSFVLMADLPSRPHIL